MRRVLQHRRERHGAAANVGVRDSPEIGESVEEGLPLNDLLHIVCAEVTKPWQAAEESWVPIVTLGQPLEELREVLAGGRRQLRPHGPQLTPVRRCLELP